MKAKLLFYELLIGSALFFGSCSTPPEPEPFSSFAGHQFNDMLSSLDKGTGDTLILGTENGKLIFYNMRIASTHQKEVGFDKVYFAHQETLHNSTKVTFVGVRNEGLKIYWDSTFSQRKTFSYGHKKENYSVYKAIRYKNKLLCSTSNGLAELDLDNITELDSLKILYPQFPQKDSVPKDYKINAMVAKGDTLFLAHKDTLITFDLTKNDTYKTEKQAGEIKNLHLINQNLMIICDTIISIKNGKLYENKQKVHSCYFTPQKNDGNNENFYPYRYLLMADNCFLIGNDLNEESLSLHRLTLDKEQYSPTAQIVQAGEFIYFISGSTLCKLPLHPTKGKHVTALARSEQALYAINNNNTVYKQDKGEWKQKFNIKDDKKDDKIHDVSTAIWTGESLCILADDNIYFQANGENISSLKKLYPSFKNDKIKRIYYNPFSKKLFFSWRSGYGYCEMKDGLPVSEAHFRNTDSIISVQCFAQPKNDANTLYIGTLNDGCIIKDLNKDSIKDKRFTKLTNIIDLMMTDTSLFVLTPVYLYRAHKDSAFFRDSIEIRDLHICRIHPLSQQKNKLLGVSQLGGLYIFSQDSLKNIANVLYPDIIFYPDAIDIQGNKIVAGTNIGLVEIDLDSGSLTTLKLTDRWYVRLMNWIKRNLQVFVKTEISVAIALIIIFVVLLFLSLDRKKKIEERNNEIKALNDAKNDLANEKKNLDKRIAKLIAKELKLEKANKSLSARKKELTEAIEKLKREFTNSHKQVKEEILSQNRRMLRTDWSIGSDPQPQSLSHYQILADYMSKKEEIERKINELEFGDATDDNLFHNKLDELTQSIHTELFTPLLKVEACVLREWVIEHERQLVQKPNEKYIKVFREQIEELVTQFLTEETIDFMPGVRERQSFEIFLRICAAALLLVPPQLLPTEDKCTKAEEKESQKAVERINSPRNFHPLLIQYKWKGVSKNNFEAKKSDMKADFELFLESEKSQNAEAYSLSFVIKNEFVKEALKKLFKMEKE